MYITDTHTHLHFEQYASDLNEVLGRAQERGVSKILTLGTDLSSSQRSLQIALQHEMVYAACGIHPTDILKGKSGDGVQIKQLCREQSKIVAVGEIGFDLYWKEVPLEKQMLVFEQMLDIAADLNLPVVIHNREAHREMREFLEKRQVESLQGVMHSFSGTTEDAQFYLELGLHISFTGVITFKNFKSIDVVKSVPLERILLETDSPFLTPVPHRGKRNEPAFVEFVARRLAEIYELPLQEITHTTFQNANRLFQWNR